MNKFNLNYSEKSIPIPSQDSFMKKMLSQTESFLRRLRWKAFFFDNPDIQTAEKETFGFKSNNCPPIVKDLLNFEADFYLMISKIEFRRTSNPTLRKIGEDAKKIRKSDHTIIPADKSSNFYQLSVEEYTAMIEKSITSDYKKTAHQTKSELNKTSASIALSLELADRVGQYQTSPAYVLLKDHKATFRSNPQCRLINPAKTDLGRISKQILERININLRAQTLLNQWKSTKDVITWFKKERTAKCKFLQFDVVSFYPSISKKLFEKALNFAKTKTQITDDELKIVEHSRNSLLFGPDGSTWSKKNGTFDVTMGSFDGAEVCELVGLLLLNKITGFTSPEKVGLYRDDGLMIIENLDGPSIERLRKKLHTAFQEEDLRITIENPSTVVDFLDVTLNSTDGSYRPFRKENAITEYVSRHSNHPSQIIKRIPEIVQQRLSTISSSEEIFNDSKQIYEKCLQRSGYTNVELKYSPDSEAKPRSKIKRTRNISWYNPPWSESVATNIGKKFFSLIDRHFPSDHRYRKFINRNNVKLSYSCMENMRSIITKHNVSLLKKHNDPAPTNERFCNCRNGTECPLDGKCLTKSIVYEATLKTSGDTFTYVGLTGDTFKARYSSHKSSFTHERYRTATTLSQKIWELKESSTDYTLSWSILKKAHAYKGGGKGKCDLCLSEKLEILKRSRWKGSLNSRTELLNKCRHQRKFTLIRTI